MSESRFCPHCGRTLEVADRFCVGCGATVPQASLYPPGPAGAQVGVRYAGFWRRVAATIIDSILLSLVTYVLRHMLGVGGSVVGILVDWLYFALLESSQHQATLGKMALGIIVTDGQGNRIGFGKATGRYFGKIVSGLLLCIGYMMAGWTARKQALHDIMADCLVVCKNPGL